MRNKVRYIFVFVILALLLSLYMQMCSSVTYNNLSILGGWGLIQILLSLYSWKKLTGTVFVPYVVFLGAAYIFTFGQSFLYVFDAVSEERDLLNEISYQTIFRAQYITLLFLNFFHVGAICSISCKQEKFNSYVFSDEERYCEKMQLKGIRAVGWLFVLFSTIPFVIESVRKYVVVSVLGYGGLYGGEVNIGVNNIVSILAQYFIPGLICLLMVYSGLVKKIIVGILLLYVLFLLYLGGRSDAVVIMSVLLLYYHICVRPFTTRQFVVLACVAYFFVSALAIIADTRSDASRDFVQQFFEKQDGNAFTEALSEMGGSMFPLAQTMELVPQMYDYRYGSSYLYAFTSVIPNMGFWDLHPAMKYGNLGDWLQKVLHLNYGPGFSIVAECYINFGYYGFVFMILLGFVFAKIFNISQMKKINPLLILLSLLFCFLVTKTVRNSFLATVRSLFYYILPIYLIVVYYYKGRIIKLRRS